MMAGRNGFSLVELLASVSLGLVALAAVGKVFHTTSGGYRANQQAAVTHDSLRFAMAQIVNDLEMAGFFAHLEDPGQGLTIPAQTRDAYAGGRCPASWLFDDLLPVDAIGNVTAARVAASFPCVRDARDGTDVLAIKRLLGECETAPAPNRFYLRTNGYLSVLHHGAGNLPAGTPCTGDAATGPVKVYQYHPAIWHIGNDHGIPSLCRVILSGARLARDCVARGIEDLQLEFGLDLDSSPGQADGVADHFVSFDARPGPAERARIVAVRVHLLGRSLERQRHVPAPGGTRSYQMGNVARRFGPDGYYRQSAVTSVPIRSAARRLSPVAIR